MKKEIDIIIPIYNAYDDLVKCVDSVKKHTDLSVHRLILINDCSTDERIIPYIYSQEAENIIVINNEQNAGFSRNVNKGMLYSEDRDVLLLNSDTIVTENWIDKIVNCAYSKPEIGTVTPMSNSATLCSYPIMCQDNDIPENWTVDSLAKVVERCSMKMYPRITVAVGFCMYIKRETIEKVGLFDAETFERGYGEENDFCNRAEQLGYIHVMCDDTFIYHKGTVSFLSEQKKALIEAHEKILIERYPAQMSRNMTYCTSDLDQFIRENIHIYTKANPKKKNLMYVVQSDFREDAFDNIGGTQHHVRDLTMSVKDEFNVYVVARDRDYLRVTMYSGEEILSLKYYIGEKEGFPRIHDSELAVLFKNILCAFQINILHVHHVYGLSFDIFGAAEELEIPTILTMHDYYYICPNVKLVDTDENYCNGYCEQTKCAECLNKNAGIYTGENYLIQWRDTCKNVFDKCKKLIVPSEAARQIYLKYYPDLGDKISVIEHGLELEKDETVLNRQEIRETYAVQHWFDILFTNENNPYVIKGWAYLSGINSEEVNTILEISCEEKVNYISCSKNMRKDLSDAQENEYYLYSGFSCNLFNREYLGKEIKVRVLLEYKGEIFTDGKYSVCRIENDKLQYSYNVAFLGGMVAEKGSKKAYEMIRTGSKEICWHIFGTIGDTELLNLQQENLIKHGTYRQQDVPDLLKENKIDLVCIMSVWPETFCYTLSEAIYSNVPVMVTDIGAAGERVRKHYYGWTVPVDYTGEQMSKYLLQILQDKREYIVKKEIATCFKEITLKDMTSHYKHLYNLYDKEYQSKEKYNAEKIFEGLGISCGKRHTPYQIYNMSLGNKNLHKEIDRYIQIEKRKEEEKQEELDAIKNSKSYRFIQRLKANGIIKFLMRLCS